MNRALAFGCLALSMSLVGTYAALSKPLTGVMPVFLLLWLRFAIGGLAMPHWLKRPAGELPMSGRICGLLFLESFFGNFLFSICMLFGVSLTSAVSAGVIMASIPAAVALLSWVLLRERPSLRVWAATACAVFGIGLLAWSHAQNAAQNLTPSAGQAGAPEQYAWLGNLLVLCAVLCEAAYAVIGKMLIGALSPRRITSLVNLWGLVLTTPMGVYYALHFDFGALQAKAWGLLLFYALAASVWTVWLWMTGLKRVPANLAGIFTVMLPIAATLTGVFVLGETLSGVRLAALAISLVGVVLATMPGGPVEVAAAHPAA